MTILEPGGRQHKQKPLQPLTSEFFLSSSPVPYFGSPSLGDIEHQQNRNHSYSALAIHSIPRDIVDTMLKHYCEIYRPLYPAIEESFLYTACDKVHNNAQASDFEAFCVYMALAISVCSSSPFTFRKLMES